MEGRADATPQAGGQRHVCYAHGGEREFRERAFEFLAGGIAWGERAMYVGTRDLEALTSDLLEMDDAVDLLDEGTIVVISLGHRRSIEEGDGGRRLERMVAATHEAVASGYRGLRVATEATELVRFPAQRDLFARAEHLIDRWMTAGPLSALCGFNTHALGAEAVAELACMHPVASADVTPFRVFARQGCDLAIAGWVDAADASAFGLAVTRALSVVEADRPVIDVSDVDFIGHHGLLALAALGRPVLIKRPPGPVRRVVEILALENVCVLDAQ